MQEKSPWKECDEPHGQHDHSSGPHDSPREQELRTDHFSYDLPEELIAQEPLEPRDRSRMMVLHREREEIEHSCFLKLPRYLQAGDLLVLNDSRVLPARLHGYRRDTGGKVEFLLLRPLGEGNVWEVLCSPGKRVKPGTEAVFGGGILEAEVLAKTPSGGRQVRFRSSVPLRSALQEVGEVPLPPYIKRELQDRERYQTVYASREGSVASPTAGLHFTPAAFEALREKSIRWTYITLHVGLGTFRPVKEEYITRHTMHSEYYELTAETAALINRTREEGRRIVAVGTTCCRVLETAADSRGKLGEGWGDTDLFIYPGYRFKAVDALLTNFHLPRSTLLMLVCAFASRELVLRAYREAVRQRYRFYSFGDCMLLL